MTSTTGGGGGGGQAKAAAAAAAADKHKRWRWWWRWDPQKTLYFLICCRNTVHVSVGFEFHVCEHVNSDMITARAFAGRGIVIRPYEPRISLEMKFVYALNRPLSDRAWAFCALVREEMETFRAETP